jgi:hypothetical protein
MFRLLLLLRVIFVRGNVSDITIEIPAMVTFIDSQALTKVSVTTAFLHELRPSSFVRDFNAE